jgi:hypothetical protein
MRGLLAMAVLAACGRVGFDEIAGVVPRDSVVDEATPADAFVCAAPWMMVSGSCYRVVSTPATWLVAEQDCEASGAHLITVIDTPEHFVMHTLSGNAGIGPSWVGFSDRRTEGTLAWVSAGGLDPAIDFCYLGNSPNMPANDCVTQEAMNGCPDWNVVDCTATRAYVCEYDGSAADPTAY